jgi:hypothetical protein
MQRNGVEMLSIINPTPLTMVDSLEQFRLNTPSVHDFSERVKDRWPQMFAAGVIAAAGMSVLADIMGRRRSSSSQLDGMGYAPYRGGGAFQPGTAQQSNKTSLALGLVMGAVASWLFLPGRKRAHTHELPASSPSIQRNKHTYYVRIPSVGEVYPRERETQKPRAKGYALRSAQDFARIGSQTGRPREIRRDRPRGKLVRRYVGGKRAFPKNKAEARRRGLLPTEMPSR